MTTPKTVTLALADVTLVGRVVSDLGRAAGDLVLVRWEEPREFFGATEFVPRGELVVGGVR